MAELAETSDVLRKRVRRLLRLDHKPDDPSELRQKIMPFLGSLGEHALIGGAIRDLARLGRRGFSSDLDFVVYDRDYQAFHRAMSRVNAKPNRFGGFALPFHQWKVDVWHLEDTWARTNNLRKVERLSDLLQCTFFDWDAAVYDLGAKRLILADNYLERLRSNVMDVSLLENPNPGGSLVRALRRAALWRVHFGKDLSNFCRSYLQKLDWSDLVRRDKKAFRESVLAHLDPVELVHRLQAIRVVNGKPCSFPVPFWQREPRFPFIHSEGTNLGPAF